MSARSIIMFILLAAAALGSWYAASSSRGDGDDAVPSEPLYKGYYLKSARILGTGPDGSLLYEIRAEHAEQENDDRISFTDVAIDYSPESEVPWRLNADSATIDQYDRRVMLRGHVRAVSSEGFSGNDTEIRTQYLELDPESYLAETPERVQIRIGARSLTATGMLASLKDNRVELKSNVSGKFVP